MAQRPTRKTGIPKSQTDSSQLNRMLSAIVERLEVLDGVRGDTLDRAVTLRDLSSSGFDVSTINTGNAGGTTQITLPPSDADGPGTGPAAPPTALAATETFLALLITWDNPAFNLQHIEVWRSATDDLSAATMVGTTVSPQFIDYVGAQATYYYWARAVGTDGTYSAFNATAGTLGTTGIDPGNLTIDPRFFVLEDGTGTELPFLTDGAGTIGIDGDLIVDGTIRAQSLIAGTIGAEYLAVTQIDAIAADLGTVTAGLFRTAASPAYRVEVQDQASTAYPLWYGSGAKSATTGRFYVDQNGNVVVKGLLNAGMIAQSYFAPSSTDYNSFRIACEYPSGYSGGVYTGKAAHICPTQTLSVTDKSLGTLAGATDYTSPTMTFYGPANTSTVQYGRLGSNTELLHLSLMVAVNSTGGVQVPWETEPRQTYNDYPVPTELEVDVQYQYDGDTAWSYLTTLPLTSNGSGATSFAMLIGTRATAFNSITFRYRVRVTDLVVWTSGYSVQSLAVQLTSASLSVSTANFGYADSTLTLLSLTETDDTPLTPEQLDAKPGVPQLPGNDGGIIP